MTAIPQPGINPVAVARPAGTTGENPYLLGVFAPVRDELTIDDPPVIGEIPKDLNGVYLRNGPSRQFEAAAQRSAVHCRDDRLGTRLDGLDDLDQDRLPRRLAEFADIGACDDGSAGT